ncbi:MAG: hypothetical protein A3F10_04890 [Coxiella sp. RIFCSPHIGHO2_12_FULL_42_15]|nr:MAG: hypothetical protein A3F10_04890 [Coxiella sp. RIFCSPHIGHO2_12_FULL_42_15]
MSVFAFSEAPLLTAEMQAKMTPDDALTRLKAGNQRFVNNVPLPTNLIKKARLSAKGQYPSAVILACMDSRIPTEIVFDQNIGNIFVTRVAANIISDAILGGLEFATKVSGAKLIVVLGHDSCGAIKGACQNVQLGHLTEVLAKIQPAIQKTKATLKKQNCNDLDFINLAAKNNVRFVIKRIPKRSPIIQTLIKEGKIKIVGAMYHLSTGRVEFFE